MRARAEALRLVSPAAVTDAPAAPARAVQRGAALLPATLAGLGVLLLLVVGALAWAVQAPLAGADAVAGRVQSGTGAMAVRHPDGGLVAALLVSEGDSVGAGTPLLRLADHAAAAEVALIEAQLRHAAARVLRHRATLLRAAMPAAQGTEPVRAVSGGGVSAAMRFADDAIARAAVASLDAARAAHSAQSRSLARQEAAVARQAALIAEELATQTRLLDQGLAQAGRSLALRREAARLDGLRAEIIAQRSRLDHALAEAETAEARARADRTRHAAEALAEAQALLDAARARLPAARARLDALTLRAPFDAIVQDIAMRPGALLSPQDAALWLVPRAAPRVVAWLPGRLAGRLAPGDAVRLRLPPGLSAMREDGAAGIVESVAADARTRAPGQPPEFRVIVDLGPAGGEMALPAGLPVEVLVPQPRRPAFEIAHGMLRAMLPDAVPPPVGQH
jgi:HlyD family secretion protein